MQNVDIDDADDERYDWDIPDYDEVLEVEDEEDPYVEYGTPHRHAVKTYQQALEADWVDEPLRELLETRIEELTPTG